MRLICVWLGALVAFIAGCQTCEPIDEKVRADFAAGSYSQAISDADVLIGERPNDQDVLNLQKSMAALAAGQPALAVQVLRDARDGVLEAERYASKSLATALNNIKAILLDDRQLPYAARDYERLMMYAVLTLGELVSGGRDLIPFAYQGQAELLERIAEYKGVDEQNPKVGYRLVSLGDYLYAAFQEEDPTRVDSARRAYERFAELEPGYAFLEEDLARLSGETQREPGAGALYVIALVGRGPEIGTIDLDSPSAAVIALLNQVWAVSKRKGTIPIVQGIKVPTLFFPDGNPSTVHVAIDGQTAGVTATVTDVDACAYEEFKVMENTIVLRACVRRVVKTIAKEVAKSATKSNEAAGLVLDGLANIWAALECADSRSWSLLPAQVQALRIELPEGEYEIALQPGTGGARGVIQTILVRVEPGRHTYVVGVHPDFEHGTIMSSSQLTSSVP